jgi:hypothetical protein
MTTMRNLAVPIFLVVAFPAFAAEPAGPALNPAMTQATITETICTTGWTRTVRPNVADMKRIKAGMLAAVGETIDHRNEYELDHVVPLALIDRRNLALQPIDEAREKDAVEVCLSSLVCQGKVTLDDAQSAIFEDWRKAGALCEETSD